MPADLAGGALPSLSKYRRGRVAESVAALFSHGGYPLAGTLRYRAILVCPDRTR